MFDNNFEKYGPIFKILYHVIPKKIHYDMSQRFENLYSSHNSDSSSDKITTKLYNKNTKK